MFASHPAQVVNEIPVLKELRVSPVVVSVPQTGIQLVKGESGVAVGIRRNTRDLEDLIAQPRV